MGYARLVALASLIAVASSCSTDPLVCTDELVAVTAAVVNRTGQAFPSLNVRDTVLRTGTIIDVSAEHPSGGLSIEGTVAVIIFSDAFKTAIHPQGEPVALPAKQAEIAEVVEALARFRPTKIAVEAPLEAEAWLDSLYQAYRNP